VIIVDASVITDVLLQARDARPIEERLFEGGQTLHCPHLLDIEVALAIRRHTINGQIDIARGRTAVAMLGALPLNRYPHSVLLARIWDLRDNVTAYDATYIALAETLRAPLITRDRRLAGAAGHWAQIELV